MIFSTFNEATEAVTQFIRTGEGEFGELALALHSLQVENVPAYRDLCLSRHISVNHWQEIPAVPTTAFRDFEITSLPLEERTAVFHSSGTTGTAFSRHWHDTSSLAIYEASLRPWFQTHLEPKNCHTLSLTPPPAEAPHSSLAHMMLTVQHTSSFAGTNSPNGWEVNADTAQRVCVGAIDCNKPLLIMGPSFSFVEWLNEMKPSIALPTGSRVMETGGYKGRSQKLPKPELHALIGRQLGVRPDHIVSEYGMCELGSQAYDRIVGRTNCPTFRFPDWVRIRIISPETRAEVAEGEAGLLQVFDLANIRSVLAILTGDLAVRRGDGFELIGRATAYEPRGCSLALSES
jgi:hypothetical protein